MRKQASPLGDGRTSACRRLTGVNRGGALRPSLPCRDEGRLGPVPAIAISKELGGVMVRAAPHHLPGTRSDRFWLTRPEQQNRQLPRQPLCGVQGDGGAHRLAPDACAGKASDQGQGQGETCLVVDFTMPGPYGTGLSRNACSLRMSHWQRLHYPADGHQGDQCQR